MKTCLLIITCFTSISCTFADAQYSINKTKYSTHNYEYKSGDPYNPAKAGFASLVVPGLGQMISGAPGRGLFSMGRCTICLGCAVGGLAILGSTDERDPDFFQKLKWSKYMWFGGTAGALINWIWGIPDAIKVAKINNLAYRDLKQKQVDLSLNPYIGLPVFTENDHLAAGVSLSIKF